MFFSRMAKLGTAICLSTAALMAQAAVTPANLQAGTETAKPVETPAAAGSASTGAPATVASPQRAADYVLGPEDQIIVHAFQAPEITNSPIQIGGDGYVNLPLVGRVKASGLAVSALEQELSVRLGNYVRDPQVTVLIADYRSQPVSVVGAVNQPGVVQLRGRKTLVEVIALAGGVRTEAGNSVTITRELSKGRLPLQDAADDPTGRFSIGHVKLHDVMEAHNPKDNIPIEANDVVMIPKAPLLYVVGEVQKPGGYVLADRDSVTVLQAVALAGGLTPLASTKHAKILHQDPVLLSRTELPTDVSKILNGKDRDVPLHGDDILFIPSSAAKSAGSKAWQTTLNLLGVAVWRL